MPAEIERKKQLIFGPLPGFENVARCIHRVGTFRRRLADYPLPQIKELLIPVGESSLQPVVILE